MSRSSPIAAAAIAALAGCSAAPVEINESAGDSQRSISVEINVRCSRDAGAEFAGDAGGMSADAVERIWECQRRCLEACEVGDQLCRVVSGYSVDVRMQCFKASAPAVCLPAPADDENPTQDRVCKTAPNWQTWALSAGLMPLGWYDAPKAVQPEGARYCALPSCDIAKP